MPLLQALAIAFTGAPIPFAKTGGFPPESIKDLIKQIKKDIQDGKDALNALKLEFQNKVNEATAEITKGLEKVEGKLTDFTKNNFAKLKQALPDLFDKEGAVAVARDKLMQRIGDVNSYANDPSNKLFGMTVSQWSTAGNTLYESMQSFKNHTNNLAGINTEEKVIIGDIIYGNVALPGTVNTSSNVASANLSKTSYSKVNVGSTVLINSSFYIVTGKTFTATVSGTVTVNTSLGNTNVYTDNIATLNLANIPLESGSTIKLAPGMYINVNNEVKQVKSISDFGDVLTVTRPFRNAVNTATTLYKETGFTVNTAFGSSNTDITVSNYDSFVCNSVCLDNVITGNGTSFASILSVGDKIYYDDLEYFVEAVTNTTITVDAPLRGTINEQVYKVTDEQFVDRLMPTYGFEDILSDFSLAEQMFENIKLPNGGDFMSDFSARYRASDGTYKTVLASDPTYVTQSIQNGPAYMAAINDTVQGLLDDLQNDAIRFMSDNELTLYLEEKLNEIDDLRNTLNDAIKEDMAAINAVKGLLKGLLKLWQGSCSKKKIGPDNVVPADDRYLQSVLVANPVRQGCDATVSNFPEILEIIDTEFTTPENEPVAPDPVDPIGDVDPDLFNQVPDALFVLERERVPGANADIVIDEDPEAQQPTPVEDPCIKPC